MKILSLSLVLILCSQLCLSKKLSLLSKSRIRDIQATVSQNDYRIISYIARGSFGVVYKAAFADGQIFAIKVIRKCKDTAHEIKSEIKILASFRIKNYTRLTRLEDVFEDVVNIYLVMNYMSNDVYAFWNEFQNKDKLDRKKPELWLTFGLFLIREMVIALRELRDSKIVHFEFDLNLA